MPADYRDSTDSAPISHAHRSGANRSKRAISMGAALALSALLAAGVAESQPPSDLQDAQITATVAARLGQYPSLSAPNTIHVSTHKHVVYVSGRASTSLQLDDAVRIARTVPGVSGVVNVGAFDN